MSESRKCDYGCGNEAKHQYKNGVWCCSKFSTQCPEKIKKNTGYYTSLEKYMKTHTHPLAGKPSWNKGLTKETDERVRRYAKTLSVTFKNGPFKGKKHRPETLEKIAIGVFNNTKRRDTDIEVIVENQLKGKVEYVHPYQNGCFVHDFYIPKENLIIECDGDYWHNLDRMKKHDLKKNGYIKKCGYKLLRLWGSTIKKKEFNVLDLVSSNEVYRII